MAITKFAPTMQTLSLFDRVTLLAPGDGHLISSFGAGRADENLVIVAANALARRLGRPVDVDVSLVKRIPMAAGLGGGSSDAAATIRLLSRWWNLSDDDLRVRDSLAETGSDVPFFAFGGTAHVGGRGDRIQTIESLPPLWAVIAVPRLAIQQKTRLLYGLLEESDFTTALDAPLAKAPDFPPDRPLFNAFCRPLYALAPAIAELHERMTRVMEAPVSLTGSGPGHFALFEHLEKASRAMGLLHRDPVVRECQIVIARFVGGTGPSVVARNQSP